ncbi:HNH endonuclease [Rossellomorea sp. BNER]|uniref:HNH endonuclease n=1 Tax=Rossellomorea sp. BNER TaxID=2962031 RepID=UPI003AF22CFF|nr:HNH endonuclease [Rossellomorea sp. BNER]
MALLKLCQCGKKISIELSRCDKCEDSYKQSKNDSDKQYNTLRDEKYTQFYKSGGWRALRAEVYREQLGLCQPCKRDNKLVKGNVVDHLIPIREDYSLRLCKENCEVKCHSCHNKKTQDDKRKYR